MRGVALLAGRLLPVVVLAGCVGTLPPQGVTMLKDINSAYRQGEYRKTITKADEFLLAYGNTEPAGEVYYLRGLAHASLKDRTRARQDFEQAARVARRSDLRPLALVSLGNLAFEQGQLSAAAEHYEQAAGKLANESPKDVVLYRLGLCLIRQGKWPASKPWFSQLMHLFPGSMLEPLARRCFAAEGFSIQCGAYTSYANAQRQVESLRARGLPARYALDTNMKHPHLVHVGFYGNYQDVRSALPRVTAIVPEAIIVP